MECCVAVRRSKACDRSDKTYAVKISFRTNNYKQKMAFLGSFWRLWADGCFYKCFYHWIIWLLANFVTVFIKPAVTSYDKLAGGELQSFLPVRYIN